MYNIEITTKWGHISEIPVSCSYSLYCQNDMRSTEPSRTFDPELSYFALAQIRSFKSNNFSLTTFGAFRSV